MDILQLAPIAPQSQTAPQSQVVPKSSNGGRPAIGARASSPDEPSFEETHARQARDETSGDEGHDSAGPSARKSDDHDHSGSDQHRPDDTRGETTQSSVQSMASEPQTAPDTARDTALSDLDYALQSIAADDAALPDAARDRLMAPATDPQTAPQIAQTHPLLLPDGDATTELSDELLPHRNQTGAFSLGAVTPEAQSNPKSPEILGAMSTASELQNVLEADLISGSAPFDPNGINASDTALERGFPLAALTGGSGETSGNGAASLTAQTGAFASPAASDTPVFGGHATTVQPPAMQNGTTQGAQPTGTMSPELAPPPQTVDQSNLDQEQTESPEVQTEMTQADPSGQSDSATSNNHTSSQPAAALQTAPQTTDAEVTDRVQDFAVADIEQSTSTRSERMTVAQLDLNVLTRPETARAVSAQIAEVVKGNSNGTIEVTLRPEELGRVTLSLSSDGAGLSVALNAERQETLDLLRRNIGTLEQELRDLGYDGLDFSFEQGTDRDDGSQSEPQAATHWAVATNEDTGTPLERAATLHALSGGMDIRL